MKKRKRVTAKLRLFPDPILTQVCEPVEDSEDVSGIIRDMMYILTNSKTGVGLAAPQAGHLKRIILAKVDFEIYRMVNPAIVYQSKETLRRPEQCLSYPDKSKSIKRPRSITVTWEEDGEYYHQEFSGFPARIIQHEIDHLNGKCKVGEKT